VNKISRFHWKWKARTKKSC